MYEIEDRASAIKELQRLLFENETGVYNDKTRNKVVEVQLGEGIEPSGIVDLMTFNAIVDRFRKDGLITKTNNNAPLEGNFPYEQGDFGNDTAILNSMLAAVIEKHGIQLWRPKGGYYSRITVSAVKRLREIFNLPPGTHIDEIFYDRLKRW